MWVGGGNRRGIPREELEDVKLEAGVSVRWPPTQPTRGTVRRPESPMPPTEIPLHRVGGTGPRRRARLRRPVPQGGTGDHFCPQTTARERPVSTRVTESVCSQQHSPGSGLGDSLVGGEGLAISWEVTADTCLTEGVVSGWRGPPPVATSSGEAEEVGESGGGGRERGSGGAGGEGVARGAPCSRAALRPLLFHPRGPPGLPAGPLELCVLTLALSVLQRPTAQTPHFQNVRHSPHGGHLQRKLLNPTIPTVSPPQPCNCHRVPHQGRLRKSDAPPRPPQASGGRGR